MSDLVIRGGTVIDGTGAPGVRADVAVDAGKITEIGAGLAGDRELDATGHVVTPGFIDIHTHYDAQVFWDPALTPSCYHGVTTVVAGNCGFSIAPTRPEHRELIARTLEKVEDMDVAASTGRRTSPPGPAGLSAPARTLTPASERSIPCRDRRRPRSVRGQMTGVLEGLRLVEGSAFVAAPLGGMTLAQLGADVIRFDDVRGGIDHDRWPVAQDGSSLFWRGMNKGKRSIAVDLRRPEGRELVTALITAPGPDAGLFLTNFPATGWLSYERLRAGRDDLIMLSLTGNPDGGTAVDYTINPATGFPAITGDGARPVNHVLPAWDVAAGLTLAVGLLAAERHRGRTGQGRHVTVSLADVAFAVVADLGYLAQAQLGAERPALGNDLYGAFGRDFVTADGRRIMVVAITERQWRSLVAATGIEEYLPVVEKAFGVRLDREGDRYAARDAIAALLAPWFAARTGAEAGTELTAAGVCWGPYQSFAEALEQDPRVSTANPLFADVEHPGIGPLRTPGSPLVFTGLERADHLRPPQVGEHTDEILTGVLGLSAREIGELHDAGVVASEVRR